MNAQKMYKMEMQAEIDRLRNRFKPKQEVPEKQEKNVEKRDQLKMQESTMMRLDETSMEVKRRVRRPSHVIRKKAVAHTFLAGEGEYG